MHKGHMIFDSMMSPLPFYLRGLLTPRTGLNQGDKLPAISAELRGYTVRREHLDRLISLCSLKNRETVPLIYPFTIIFPLHMSIVTHKEFPFCYLKMLQVRNHLIQFRQIRLTEEMDIFCQIVAQRTLEKGLEIDIHSVARSEGEPVWESLHTYFFRGRFGDTVEPSPLSRFHPLPENSSEAAWEMPVGGGFRFGLITGDYNGIHYFPPYARLFGFRRDFMHSQRVLAQCLDRLPQWKDTYPIRLDAALKGSVYYKSPVRMRSCIDHKSCRFDLFCSTEPRPCITGALKSLENNTGLMLKA